MTDSQLKTWLFFSATALLAVILSMLFEDSTNTIAWAIIFAGSIQKLK